MKFFKLLTARNNWELLGNIAARNLKLKYKGSFLGFLWSLITPLLQMLIYTVVFSYIIRVKVEWPFAVFLLTAQLPWIFFSGSLQMGAGSIIEHGNLVKKVNFPRGILPLATVVSNMVSFGITLIVLLLFLIGYKIPFTQHVVMVIPAILILFMFTLGLTFITSSLAIFFRDVFHILEILLLVWFWAVPIVYPMTLLEDLGKEMDTAAEIAIAEDVQNSAVSQGEKERTLRFKKTPLGHNREVAFLRLYKLNPMVEMLELFRYAFLYQAWPPMKHFLYALFWGIGTLISGYYIFRRTSPYFAREI